MKSKILQLLVLILIVLVQAQITIAQPGPHRGYQRGMPSVEKMQEDLNLSEDQATQIKTIQEKYRAQRKALREGNDTDRAANREKIRSMMEAQKEEIEKVLTDEQKAKIKTHRQGRRAAFEKIDKKGMDQEFKAYKEANIIPVLQQQRAKLESKINDVDKATIAELRTEMKAMKEEYKEKMKARKEAFKNGERPDHEAIKQKRMAAKEEHKSKKEAIGALVEKYDNDITSLLAEVAPKKAQWNTDMKAIKDKYLPAEMQGKEIKKGHGKRKHRKGQKRKRHNGDNKDKGEKAMFLLLEPNESNSTLKQSVITDVQVYPSPAINNNTIRFELKQAGRVQIDLVDKQGNVLQKVVDEVREVGAYNEEVNLINLNGMLFYYRIIDPSGQVISKKFLIAKE